MEVFFKAYNNFDIGKYKTKIIILYFATIINLLLEIFSLSLIIPIVGVILDSQIFNEYEIIKNIILVMNPLQFFYKFNESFNLLGGLCTIYFIIILIKNITLFFIIRFQSKFIFQITLEIKSNFLSKIIEMPYLYLNKYKFSGLITFNNNVSTITETLSVILTSSIEIILILGILIFLFINSPEAMIMIMLISLILLVFNKFYLNKKLNYHSEQIKVHEKEQVNFLLSSLKGLKEIKLNNLKDFFLSKYKTHLNISNEANFHFQVLSSSMRLLIEVLAAILITSILIYFIISNLSINEIITTLAVFLAGAFKILPSLNKLTVSYQYLQFTKARLNDLNSFYEKNLVKLKNVIEFKFTEKIEIKNLNYSYDGEKEIFSDCNFEISKGDKIYIKGESGSGKSTLMNIISGLIDVKDNNYLIDKKNIIFPFRITNLGYLTQKPFFIPDTIRQNICLGIPKDQQDEKKIFEHLKELQIYDAIKKMKNGVDTIISNDGEGLSGGQLQRIALARLLYTNPELIILDESTNAVDQETENLIMNNLFKNYSSKTIIIISHRDFYKLNFNKHYSIINNKIERNKN